MIAPSLPVMPASTSASRIGCRQSQELGAPFEREWNAGKFGEEEPVAAPRDVTGHVADIRAPAP